jgi:hypothetical protein
MVSIIQSKIFCLPISYKKLKIKIYKNVLLPVVLYGCETWSVTLREEHRLRAFENRVLRRIFGRKKDHGENCIMMNFITCILYLILLGWLNRGGRVGRDMWHSWGEGRVVYRVLVGRPEDKRPLERPRRRWITLN